jgi:hypothetical protein
MSYESRITEKALTKNTKMPDNVNYAKTLARSLEDLETFDIYIKWLNLDPTNRKLIADELGLNEIEFRLFLAVNKAIFNGSKIDRLDLLSEEEGMDLFRRGVTDFENIQPNLGVINE